MLYQDWQRLGLDSAGIAYAQQMGAIQGNKWLNSPEEEDFELEYSRSEDAASTSMMIFAGTGMFNSVFAVAVYILFLWDYENNTPFWFAWLSAFSVNGLLWIPMFVSWPALFSAGSDMINVMAFLAQATYFGVFGGYWFSAGALAYTFLIEPTESKSTFESNSDAYIWLFGYIGLCLFDSAITLMFVDNVVDFADKRNKADALALEAAIK